MLTSVDFHARVSVDDLFVLVKALESLHKSAALFAPSYKKEFANSLFDISVVLDENGRVVTSLLSADSFSVTPLDQTEADS